MSPKRIRITFDITQCYLLSNTLFRVRNLSKAKNFFKLNKIYSKFETEFKAFKTRLIDIFIQSSNHWQRMLEMRSFVERCECVSICLTTDIGVGVGNQSKPTLHYNWGQTLILISDVITCFAYNIGVDYKYYSLMKVLINSLAMNSVRKTVTFY